MTTKHLCVRRSDSSQPHIRRTTDQKVHTENVPSLWASLRTGTQTTALYPLCWKILARAPRSVCRPTASWSKFCWNRPAGAAKSPMRAAIAAVVRCAVLTDDDPDDSDLSSAGVQLEKRSWKLYSSPTDAMPQTRLAVACVASTKTLMVRRSDREARRGVDHTDHLKLLAGGNSDWGRSIHGVHSAAARGVRSGPVDFNVCVLRVASLRPRRGLPTGNLRISTGGDRTLLSHSPKGGATQLVRELRRAAARPPEASGFVINNVTTTSSDERLGAPTQQGGTVNPVVPPPAAGGAD